MAKFDEELPNELINELTELGIATPDMMGEMTKAGAELVAGNVRSNLHSAFNKTDKLEDCLYVSKTYKTPSDDGINNKVYIYGYLDSEKKHPAPLVANAREYGSSRTRNGKTWVEPKKPFFRKSFKDDEIEKVMQDVEDKYLPKEE